MAKFRTKDTNVSEEPSPPGNQGVLVGDVVDFTLEICNAAGLLTKGDRCT